MAREDGLNPDFGSGVDKLRAAAEARGIKTHIISGLRTREDQEELYANYLAGKRGQPLPFPKRGAVPLAAKPGSSLHEQGLAADIEADDPSQEAELRAMAPQFGLRTIGPSDPNHFQFGGPSRQPANLQNRGTSSQAPIAAQPSGDMTHEEFIRDYAKKIGVDPDLAVGIANAEGLRAWSKSNPNAGSYVDRTGGVPWSFGDFQLNTRNGMGVDALKAGIDPRDPNQWQAADKYALDRMKSEGVGAWRGDPVARAYLASGKVPGTSLTSTGAPPPPDAYGYSHSPGTENAPTGTTPTAVATTPPVEQSPWDKWLKKPEPTVDKDGKPVQGKSKIEQIADKLGDAAGGNNPLAPPQQMQMMPVQDPTAQMAGPAAQLFAQVQEASAKPLTWSSKPYGWNAGQQMGTTLNSVNPYG